MRKRNDLSLNELNKKINEKGYHTNKIDLEFFLELIYEYKYSVKEIIDKYRKYFIKIVA